MLLVSAEEGTNQESTQEQIFENIRLHKEVIQSVKLQPWHIRKKLKLVRQVSEGGDTEGAFTWHALAPLNLISYVNFATLSRPRFGGALYSFNDVDRPKRMWHATRGRCRSGLPCHAARGICGRGLKF